VEALGIDVGGTGIKGALVNTSTGEMLTERHRLLTPRPATPSAVIEAICALVCHFSWRGPLGCGFPSVVKDGIVCTAANISQKWIGFDVRQALCEATGCSANVINDADAAGLAEMHFGAGKDQTGVVLIVTLGTGIGTALFTEGHLVPNLELGHIEIDGADAECLAAERVRIEEGLSWKKYARRVDRYLRTIEALLWPDLIIVGGGVSKAFARIARHLTTRTPVVPAATLNEAGIVGAALAAPREAGG